VASTGGVRLNGDPPELPSLFTLDACGGDWDAYIEKLYEGFIADFIDNPVGEFAGLRFGLKRGDAIDGKEPTFWHLVSKERGDERRTPDARRCERLRWPRVIVAAAKKGHNGVN